MPVVDSARAADPIPTACTQQAVRQDIQSGGNYAFDCPGPATIDAVDGSGDPQAFIVPAGTSVSFNRIASQVTLDVVGIEARCSSSTPAQAWPLTGITVQDGVAGAIDGTPEAAKTDGLDGTDGQMGSDGGDGQDGGAEHAEHRRRPRGPTRMTAAMVRMAMGRAIDNSGVLTLHSCTVLGGEAIWIGRRRWGAGGGFGRGPVSGGGHE